ncbi:MAG: transposase [Deltaproteobacteria bacterium]|jgi:hypothetical protein|nr:transposase [Deltaproteobacteria bacterium]
MIEFPETIEQFEALFNSEDACVEYLIKARWPEGFRCDKCQNHKYWLSGNDLKCTVYGKNVILMAGTTFQNT